MDMEVRWSGQWNCSAFSLFLHCSVFLCFVLMIQQNQSDISSHARLPRC